MTFYGSFLHLILRHAPGFQISILFPHFSDPCCPIVGQWVGSYARSIADLMQSLEKAGLLIKNHRVNKSLDPEEFSDLPLSRHTHHHRLGSSAPLLLPVFPSGKGYASVRWCQPTYLPKRPGLLILVSPSSFTFSSHFRQGRVIRRSSAWTSGGLCCRPGSVHKELGDCGQPLTSLGAPTSLICEVRNRLYPCSQVPSTSHNFQNCFCWSFLSHSMHPVLIYTDGKLLEGRNQTLFPFSTPGT